jgi:hypothetical protein
VGCVGPFVLLIILFVVFTFNNRPSDIKVPIPTLPANNGYDDFILASKVVSTIVHISPSSMNTPPATRDEYLAQTKACTEESAAALAVLRSGFSKPYLSKPVRTLQDAIQENSTYGGFRELSRTISGVAVYYELTGQNLKWADTLLDGEEMGVTIPHGGAVIAELVGIASENISLARFEQVLPLWKPDELTHVAKRLEIIQNKRTRYSEILLEDGYVMISETQEHVNDPKARSLQTQWEALKEVFSDKNAGPSSGPGLGEVLREMFRNKTEMLKEELAAYREAAAESEKPFTSTPSLKNRSQLFSTIAPVLVQGRAKHVTMESVVNILRLEVALYQFKAANGRFPSQLTELSPTYLLTISPDPLTGASNKPYHYSLNSSTSFSLYGVGPDMTDHGGQFGKHAGDNGFNVVAGHISRTRKLFP